MCRLKIVFVLAFLLSGFCRAEDAPSYEIHEWGVFPVPRNSAWAMSDTRADLSSMPKFFWKTWPEERLPWRGPVRKPVVYFYAEKPLSVDLKIRFADGRPLVWWPAAESPAGGVGNVNPQELHFSLRVGHYAPPGSWQQSYLQRVQDQAKIEYEERCKKAAPPEVEKGHWMEALRVPASASVYTNAGYSSKRGRDDGEDQVEKFIYYDGIMKAPDSPQVSRDGEALTLKSNFAYAISDVLVIDRNATRTRISKGWSNVAAGEQNTHVEMIAAGDGKGDAKAIESLAEEFVKHLVAAGLTQEEAVGLEKVWHEGVFLREGVNIMYRVPQSVYDQWLPLTAKPEPKKIVRVGLVFHEHMEPELEANVLALIKKMSADEFADRQAAMQALMTIGGAAFPYIEAAINDKKTDLETANGCRKILEKLDARPALQAIKK